MSGMHQAIIAAELPCADLLDALAAHVGPLEAEGPVDSLQAVDLVSTQGRRRLVAGELDGCSCIVDGPALWGVSRPDALAAVAARSGALVVACGAESAAGVYAFFAARGRQVLRIHHHDTSAMARPFDWGEALPTEAECGLDQRHGQGLMAALAHFRVDYPRWLREAPKQALLHRLSTVQAADRPAILDGPVAHALARHRQAHALPGPGPHAPARPGLSGRGGMATGGPRHRPAGPR